MQTKTNKLDKGDYWLILDKLYEEIDRIAEIPDKDYLLEEELKALKATAEKVWRILHEEMQTSED